MLLTRRLLLNNTKKIWFPCLNDEADREWDMEQHEKLVNEKQKYETAFCNAGHLLYKSQKGELNEEDKKLLKNVLIEFATYQKEKNENELEEIK